MILKSHYFKSFYENFTIVFTLIIAYPCFMHYDPSSIILPKKSSQKNPPKKFLPKTSSQENPPNKILQKNSQKIPPKFQKNSKNFKTISQKIPKILKISNSLHRTWMPKTLSGLFSRRMQIKKVFVQL